MGRHPGGDCLLPHLVVQFTQPGVNGVHLRKRVPDLIYGHLTGGNSLPYFVQIVQSSKVDSVPPFVKPRRNLLLFILPSPVCNTLGECGPEEGEAYQVSVDLMSLTTCVLSQCPNVHPNQQLPTCGGPTLAFVCGIMPSTAIEVFHGVLHHIYPSVLYLQDCR